MLNYGDRLLMGQYPTGELFAYDGERATHLPKWPPAMSGVRKNAREAQTLTIYGGDLYVGVWPWAEVWKYGGPMEDWAFQGRMFTHPEPTTETTHPYENETAAVDVVYNLCGQRVTSMVPLGDSLFISTSAKSNTPFGPKFDFLTNSEMREYGTVYAYNRPGCLAVETEWTDGPTTFEFHVSGDRMSVRQDGKLAGSAVVDRRALREVATDRFRFGKGVFGAFQGQIVEHNIAFSNANDEQ